MIEIGHVNNKVKAKAEHHFHSFMIQSCHCGVENNFLSHTFFKTDLFFGWADSTQTPTNCTTVSLYYTHINIYVYRYKIIDILVYLRHTTRKWLPFDWSIGIHLYYLSHHHGQLVSTRALWLLFMAKMFGIRKCVYIHRLGGPHEKRISQMNGKWRSQHAKLNIFYCIWHGKRRNEINFCWDEKRVRKKLIENVGYIFVRRKMR